MKKFQPLKKASAFWAAYWGLLSVYFITLFLSPDIADSIAVPVVAALVTLSGISQGWNVAESTQRSKYYIPELNKEKECAEKDT